VSFSRSPVVQLADQRPVCNHGHGRISNHLYNDQGNAVNKDGDELQAY